MKFNKNKRCFFLFLLVWGITNCAKHDLSKVPQNQSGQEQGKISSDEGKKHKYPPIHPCEREINGPAEAWKSIVAVRDLAEKERAKCSLTYVEKMAPNRTVPADILEPIIVKSVKDKNGFNEWVKQKIEDNPSAALQAVAMDILLELTPADDFKKILKKTKKYRLIAKKLKSGSKEIINICDEADKLKDILNNIKKIHKLRCMLEVNPLGFAVKCKTIHRQNSQINLSWLVETRDDLLISLKVKNCKGKSCKKLKNTAVKLEKLYLETISQIESLKTEVFILKFKDLMILPEFKSSEGGVRLQNI